ncbi:Small ubiquitin-related modifier 1 [Capsicum annuum]|nr:Small ubiquitin-related modifier 1 [Capsicum annuum]
MSKAATREEDSKLTSDQSGHINLKVKTQVVSLVLELPINFRVHVTVMMVTVDSGGGGCDVTLLDDGNEVFFRIKRSTQLKKLMNAYCDRKSVNFNAIAFLFDGRRLRAEQTPDELEMEDGDEIDAMLHQTGGTTL